MIGGYKQRVTSKNRTTKWQNVCVLIPFHNDGCICLKYRNPPPNLTGKTREKAKENSRIICLPDWNYFLRNTERCALCLSHSKKKKKTQQLVPVGNAKGQNKTHTQHLLDAFFFSITNYMKMHNLTLTGSSSFLKTSFYF